MPHALPGKTVDIGVGDGVIARPATLASRYASAQPAGLSCGRVRSRALSPQVLTKPLR
jgi:hypothetical protein